MPANSFFAKTVVVIKENGFDPRDAEATSYEGFCEFANIDYDRRFRYARANRSSSYEIRP